MSKVCAVKVNTSEQANWANGKREMAKEGLQRVKNVKLHIETELTAYLRQESSFEC